MSDRPSLAFWYDFASSYSYLTSIRIERVCASAGVAVAWRPFLLGPIFASQGWSTSPFNLHAAKGRYMVRDITRRAAALGRSFRLPQPFPAASAAAARIAVAHQDAAWIGAFSRAVFAAEFERGADIADTSLLRAILVDFDLPADEIMAAALSEDNKPKLRAATQEAIAAGIFGAPSFVTADGELYWGDDRLEEAVGWAARGASVKH